MIIIAGLIIAFVLMLLFSNRKMRDCRWRENRREGHWHCVQCGAKSDGRDAPKACMRGR